MSFISRQEFDTLEGEKLINYINSLMANGHTVTDLIKELKIKKGTVYGRIKDTGYSLDKRLHAYVIPGSIQEDHKPVEASQSPDAISIIQQDILMLKNEIYKIYSLIDDASEDISDAPMNFRYIDGESKEGKKFKLKTKSIKARTFKIDEDILSSFDEFCKINGNLGIQNIISKALLEFVNKYKNKE